MKHLYTSLRTAFLPQGLTAPVFDANERPTEANNLEISIDTLRQEQPPFDVYSAEVTLHFFDAFARADLGPILRQALASFLPLDERNGTPAPDNTDLITLLAEPEFSNWTQSLDAETATPYQSVTVSLTFQ